MQTTICAGALAAVMMMTQMTLQPAEITGYLYDDTVTIHLSDRGAVNELTLHDYLVGVVLEEMPASFEEEALKAQAVAARTFTMRRVAYGGKHDSADVCGDSTCCQCYLDEQERIEKYGDGYAEACEKVQAAVEATDGQVLVCDGKLIDAAYFSSTGGSTETAAAVWGSDVSYLQTVSSPEEARVSEVVVPFETFRNVLTKSQLDGNPTNWIGSITYTDGGAVKTIEIGGAIYTGTEIRSLFSLKSARFTVSMTADSVVFEVTGSGHGVGLSQYGANEMAATGESYRDILLHYYTGVELKELY